MLSIIKFKLNLIDHSIRLAKKKFYLHKRMCWIASIAFSGGSEIFKMTPMKQMEFFSKKKKKIEGFKKNPE